MAQDPTNSIRILLRAILPKYNLSAGELSSFKKSKEDDSIVVLPADKERDTVVLNIEDYFRNKIRELLDPAIYGRLLCDPTAAALLRKTVELLKRSYVEPDVKMPLRCSQEGLSSRLCAEIHEEEVLRSIVSAIGSPIYSLTKHLTGILHPHMGEHNRTHKIPSTP